MFNFIYIRPLVAEKNSRLIKAFKHKTFYISIKFYRGNKMENKMSRKKKSDVKYPTVEEKFVLEFLKIDDGGYQISMVFHIQLDSFKKMILTILF